MGLWSTIKNVFGAGDKPSKVADFAMDSVKGIGEWIDEKDFTPEEKSKAYLESAKVFNEFVSMTINENSNRSITRRWLAWGIAGFTLFWANVAMILAIFQEGAMEDGGAVSRMIAVADAWHLGWAFVSVVILYFGVQFKRLRG